MNIKYLLIKLKKKLTVIWNDDSIIYFNVCMWCLIVHKILWNGSRHFYYALINGYEINLFIT